MLSYQHIYHAGNFADVQKHALLIRVIQTLKDKADSVCLIDTHAGRGLYDLTSDEALKTGESANGVARLLSRENSPPVLAAYLQALNRHAPLYPGSAALARDALRPQDQLIAAEMHPGEHKALSSALGAAPNLSLIREDGYGVLAQALPAREKRALAVIDPPYEVKTEYAALPRHVERAWRKAPKTSFFIWYPILSAGAHEPMLAALHQSGIPDILVSEVTLPHMPAQGFAMFGSGVILINPPVAERAVTDITAAAAEVVGGESQVFWLANRRLDPETQLLSPL